MRTKIVYVLISSGNDIYIEQAYMSMWSCRYYNPEANIVLVTDSDTMPHLEKYPEMKTLISEFSIHEFKPEISNFERSRFLKTSLRPIVEGDFLFVDTDTIFCDSVKEIDSETADIAMVENMHDSSLLVSPYRKRVGRRFYNLYGTKLNEDSTYYNSGVVYSKDSQLSRAFYIDWHMNWLNSKNKPQGMFDQPALMKTLLTHPNYIRPLNGIYNVQISASIEYLYSGKIIHFFNVNLKKNTIHPFLDRSYYIRIKQYEDLFDEVKLDITNCKNLFVSPTCIVGPENAAFWNSSSCIALKNIQNYKILATPINTFLKVTNKVLSFITQHI